MSVWGAIGGGLKKIAPIAGLAIGGPLGLGLAAAGGFGFGGGKKNADQPTNPEDPITTLLKQYAGQQHQQGQQLAAEGADVTAPAAQYLKSLLSSDPSAVMDATRQDRGRVMDQYDTARRAISQFGPRGGGTTGTLAQSRFDQAESLADITSAARGNAASGAAELGVQLSGLGLTAENLATQDLNSVINAVLNREYINTQKRGQNIDAATGIGEAIGNIIGLVIAGKGGGKA